MHKLKLVDQSVMMRKEKQLTYKLLILCVFANAYLHKLIIIVNIFSTNIINNTFQWAQKTKGVKKQQLIWFIQESFYWLKYFLNQE